MTTDLAYILKDYAITNTAKVIWGYLYSLSKASEKQGKPFVFVGYRKIAERVGVCEKTVYSSMRQLKAAGLIVVKRRGQGLNSQTYVFSPSMPQKERETKEKCASSYGSRHVKKTAPILKNKSVNNSDSRTIFPDNPSDNAPMAQKKGISAPKGKPTPKQKSNFAAKQQAKKRYKDYLYQRLNMADFENDMFADSSEVEAVKKAIDLMANAVVSKGNIYYAGTLLAPQSWWSCAKSITRESLIELLYRLEKQKIKNYRAYFLSAVYSEGMRISLSAPFYSA